MNHPVVSRYFDTLKGQFSDTVWGLDTSISIPFDPALENDLFLEDGKMGSVEEMLAVTANHTKTLI